ncbi:tripartite tricarboxylate transporter substrate binding protein [soil metagenome]|nr:tripartite tricarboxylate transporter substrate binding protein [Trueperaceae bacterium]
MRRFITTVSALFVAIAALATNVGAQEYPWNPTRPITIIVPWAAGGATDQLVRVIASELEDELDQSVVVVNQPGASGSIGTKNTLDAARDGYTWTSGAVENLGTYGVLDMLDTSLDDWHVFLAVANVAVISVNPNAPYQDFGEFLAALEANPGQISVATAGVGSSGHKAIEAIAQSQGLEYRHVTYEGGNPAVIATVGGETQVTPQLASEQAEMIRGNRLRPLAVMSAEPLDIAGYGTIPPVTDWLSDLDLASAYFGIWVPVGVPDEVIETFTMIWENRIATSEVLQSYALERGAIFTPFHGDEAHERGMVTVTQGAWSLYDSGAAPIDPSTLGIPRP